MNIRFITLYYCSNKLSYVAGGFCQSIIVAALLNCCISSVSFAAGSETDTRESPPSINLAVAANFKTTLQLLVDQFLGSHYDKLAADKNKPRMRIISGSTGALYAQITQGAPFDIFFAADSIRPKQLLNDKLTSHKNLSVYAKGEIALVVNKKNFNHEIIKNPCAQLLQQPPLLSSKTKPATMAIANPRTAPYGSAALELMESMPEVFKHYRIVRGKNVLHAQQLLLNGNADIAVLSTAQAFHPTMADYLFCPVDQQFFSPIEQSMAIIKQNRRSAGAEKLVLAFYDYIKSTDAQGIIANQGYSNNGSTLN